MSLSLLIAITFSLSSLLWIRQVVNPQAALIHFLLLLVTPWLIVLSLSQPGLRRFPPTRTKLTQISDSFAYFTGSEFLFFSGDRREWYSPGEHGVFLLSFLPLILIGIYRSLTSSRLRHKAALFWLVFGLSLSLLLTNVPGLPGSLWFLPSLSLLATVGATKLISIYRHPKTSRYIKRLIFGLFLLLLYESARLYQVIIYHQPFS